MNAITDPSPGPVVEASPLLRWLTSPSPTTAIRFATPDGWERWSYRQLATRIRNAAAGLAAAGIGRGDVVSIVDPDPRTFTTAFFAAMVLGAVPAPLAPPGLGVDMDAFRDAVVERIAATGPVAVVAHQRVVPVLRPCLDRLAVRLLTEPEQLAGEVPVARWPRPDGDAAAGDPAALALLQLTSGSTGAPRPVPVTRAALAANADAIARWLGMGPDDATASWLPLHHDMGLVGCLVAPVVRQCDLWLMTPERFLRAPVEYLRCFGAFGAQLTAMPPFGLDYIAERVRPEHLRGLDFRTWRAVIVGAQWISAHTLERFHRTLAPNGFAETALLPAYGLAEATLAVTGLPLPERWQAIEVDPGATVPGTPVAAPGAGCHSSRTRLVGCGRPLERITVTIRDDDDRPLPDGHLGEIVVEGPSVVAPGPGRLPTGRPVLRTGDLGLLRDGQLFVLGRRGDSIKVRGRTVVAESVEAVLHNDGLPAARSAVALGTAAGGPGAVLVVEGDRVDTALLDAARATLARLSEVARPEVIRVPLNTIPRTTSGKPRRRALWDAYLAGTLPRLAEPGRYARRRSRHPDER